jgi:hypothetical protein
MDSRRNARNSRRNPRDGGDGGYIKIISNIQLPISNEGTRLRKIVALLTPDPSPFTPNPLPTSITAITAVAGQVAGQVNREGNTFADKMINKI